MRDWIHEGVDPDAEAVDYATDISVAMTNRMSALIEAHVDFKQAVENDDADPDYAERGSQPPDPYPWAYPSIIQSESDDLPF
jgi:hypothetical protein